MQRTHLSLFYSYLLIFSCSSGATQNERKPPPTMSAEQALLSEGRRYIDDAAFRRASLQKSLVNSENDYAKARLAHYTEDDWGKLRVLNTRYRPVRPADLGASTPKPDDSWVTLDTAIDRWDANQLLALGKSAFEGYPAQIEHAMFYVLKDKERPRAYGLWQTPDSVGGLIWVALPGGVYPSFTCATCHASVNGQGRLVHGMPNHDLDLGKARDDALRRLTSNRTWGKGRVDISTDGVVNPIAIPDLRAVRFQTYLHRTANVRNSPLFLALRIETGLIGISGHAVRPPRSAMFALASYIWRLGESLPLPEKSAGRAVFETRCASCHALPTLAGAPISIEQAHADEKIVRSPSRFTGKVQVPSLRGLSGRRRLLSDGSMESPEALLDPKRALKQHPFGLNLNDRDRRALLQFLNSL